MEEKKEPTVVINEEPRAAAETAEPPERTSYLASASSMCYNVLLSFSSIALSMAVPVMVGVIRDLMVRRDNDYDSRVKPHEKNDFSSNPPSGDLIFRKV